MLNVLDTKKVMLKGMVHIHTHRRLQGLRSWKVREASFGKHIPCAFVKERFDLLDLLFSKIYACLQIASEHAS